MKTITVRNIAQKVLFECELQGQISDGHWENATPHSHWQDISSAIAIVDPENAGKIEGFYLKRKYNFANADLLSVVGDRMILAVKVVMAHPEMVLDMSDHHHWEDKYADSDLVNSQNYDYKQLIADLKDLSKLVNQNY